MVDAPWLTTEKLRLVHLILNSYQKAFGTPLLVCNYFNCPSRTVNQEVFAMRKPLLSHDLTRDPCLTYVNASALLLWHCRWDEMVGIPSRITAPTNQRQQRSAVLNRASNKTSLSGYSGIRVDSLGRRFYIKNAQIWTIWNEIGLPYGQAATFSSWEFL